MKPVVRSRYFWRSQARRRDRVRRARYKRFACYEDSAPAPTEAQDLLRPLGSHQMGVVRDGGMGHSSFLCAPAEASRPALLAIVGGVCVLRSLAKQECRTLAYAWQQFEHGLRAVSQCRPRTEWAWYGACVVRCFTCMPLCLGPAIIAFGRPWASWWK